MKAAFFVSRKIIMIVSLLFIGILLAGCTEVDKTLGTHLSDGGDVTFDKHGCLIKNGSYFDDYCYAKQYSGNQWYGYELSVLRAAGWDPNQATASVIRDFSQGLSVLKWRDAYGDGTWYLKDNKTGNVNAYYKGKWMPVQDYKDTVATEIAIDKINQESNQKIIETILAPECTHSFNGC